MIHSLRTKIKVLLLPLILSSISYAQEFVPNFRKPDLDPTRISLPKKQGTIVGLAGQAKISGNGGEAKYSYALPELAWRKPFFLN